jgi:hypothetical protein
MDAASLVKLAAARGIDLSHIAGVASDLQGIAKQRKYSPTVLKSRRERHLNLEVSETGRGRETRTYRQAQWSVADLGMAAKGLGAIPWAAALYSFAGSRDGYWLLWHALANEAHRIGRREYWPPRVLQEDGRRRFFRENLAELVLIEDANRHLFVAAPTLYAIYMGVAPETWDRHLSGPFKALQGSYEHWLSIARSVIAGWICNQPAATRAAVSQLTVGSDMTYIPP